ncbi:hypothetical protein K456DRAFT_1731360 [Colletotrichum gloeosporioides 23]|nr:hypothetical protein K456DRAFT_1731360 [Colletotrichum gloeosporioides 23]
MEEQLTEALERVKLLEQEGDAFITLAKEEEVARIAAVSILKRKDDISKVPPGGTPCWLPHTADIISSAATEEEIEHLNLQLD